MRDLKFKAIVKDTGKIYWFDLRWGNHERGNGYIGMVPWGEKQDLPGRYRGNMLLVDPEECEILQFTGLLDTKGKEIYEGDTLSIMCRNKHGHQPDMNGKRVIVGSVEFGRICVDDNSCFVYRGFHVKGRSIEYLLSMEAEVDSTVYNTTK